MLKEAYSFNDDNIKIDFVVIDTIESDSVLFNSMTLPISNEEIKDSHGIVHEFYSVENKTLYSATQFFMFQRNLSINQKLKNIKRT